MSAVKVSGISIGFLLVSFVTNRVSLEEECLPGFEVRNILRAPIQNSVAFIAHSSTGDVAITNGTVILSSRAWIRMYVARHLEEHA